MRITLGLSFSPSTDCGGSDFLRGTGISEVGGTTWKQIGEGRSHAVAFAADSTAGIAFTLTQMDAPEQNTNAEVLDNDYRNPSQPEQASSSGDLELIRWALNVSS